jgi:hypothetical protein
VAHHRNLVEAERLAHPVDVGGVGVEGDLVDRQPEPVNECETRAGDIY